MRQNNRCSAEVLQGKFQGQGQQQYGLPVMSCMSAPKTGIAARRSGCSQHGTVGGGCLKRCNGCPHALEPGSADVCLVGINPSLSRYCCGELLVSLQHSCDGVLRRVCADSTAGQPMMVLTGSVWRQHLASDCGPDVAPGKRVWSICRSSSTACLRKGVCETAICALQAGALRKAACSWACHLGGGADSSDERQQPWYRRIRTQRATQHRRVGTCTPDARRLAASL